MGNFTKPVVWLLVVVSTAYSLAYPLVYLDYYMRQDYIAENFCEQREQEITICYGKCTLTKTIAAMEEKKEQENKTIQEPDYTLFIQYTPPSKLSVAYRIEEPEGIAPSTHYHFDLLKFVFRPPIA